MLSCNLAAASKQSPHLEMSNALRTSTLGHKPGDHAVKLQFLVKALLGELHEVRDRVGRVFLKKLHGHCAVVGVNLGVHATKMHHRAKAPHLRPQMSVRLSWSSPPRV